MARVFITGATTGLGLAAARSLLDDGHEVVLHARNAGRAADLADLAPHAAGIAVAISQAATRRAGWRIKQTPSAESTPSSTTPRSTSTPNASRPPDGHARTLAVNTLAPYMLTAWISRPSRLVYISSGMHKQGDRSLRDIDWTARSWSI